MGSLLRLSARLGETGRVALLAVDVGEPEVRIRRFFEREFGGRLPPFPILIDADRAALKAWRVDALPTSYLVGADHVVRLTAAGPVDWDDPRTLAALDDLDAGRPLPPDLTLPAITLPETSGSPEP